MSFPVENMPPKQWIPSGIIDTILMSTISGVAFLSAYPGIGCETILFVTSGSYIKIFEGYNGTYLYNTPRGILFSDDLNDWSSVGNWASSITQVDTGEITILFQNNSSSVSSKVYTQYIPETYGGWTLETTLAGTIVSDSAGEPDSVNPYDLPVLVGNNRLNSFSRILRNGNTSLPIGSFSDSDAGIPQTSPTIAQITDLEAV